MGISTDIGEDLAWPGEGRLGIDHPFRIPGASEMAAERGPFRKGLKLGEEMELTGSECGFEIVQEQATKQARQNPDGKEEARPASNPSIAFERDAAAGNQT